MSLYLSDFCPVCKLTVQTTPQGEDAMFCDSCSETVHLSCGRKDRDREHEDDAGNVIGETAEGTCSDCIGGGF